MNFHASPTAFNTDPDIDFKTLTFSICGFTERSVYFLVVNSAPAIIEDRYDYINKPVVDEVQSTLHGDLVFA